MPIINFQTDFPGQVGLFPRHGKMETTDVVATITTAGYLNNNPSAAGVNISDADMIDIKYNDGSGGVTSSLFRVSIASNGIITLNNLL
jgi:hypothetical protein